MFFWIVYILSSFVISYILSLNFKGREWRLVTLFFIFFLLITPERFGIGDEDFSPAMFQFLFELVLERNLSAVTLRPLIFSLPFSFLLSIIFISFKRKFFQI